MSSILDIDLDYFYFFDKPVEELDRLLAWAGRPVDFVVEHHHEAFERWVNAVKHRVIRAPQFILHVDEHHDMLSDRASDWFRKLPLLRNASLAKLPCALVGEGIHRLPRHVAIPAGLEQRCRSLHDGSLTFNRPGPSLTL